MSDFLSFRSFFWKKALNKNKLLLFLRTRKLLPWIFLLYVCYFCLSWRLDTLKILNWVSRLQYINAFHLQVIKKTSVFAVSKKKHDKFYLSTQLREINQAYRLDTMDKGHIIASYSQFTRFNANQIISVVTYFSTRDLKK